VKPVQRTNRNTERLVSWRSKWLLLFTLFLMMQQGAVVSAHMTVEDRFYEDVVYSKSMEQIVLLRSLNVISADSYVSLFMPQEKLTRADLALWSANFRRLAESGSKPEQWRQAAMEHRLVASLDGYATYRDINQAYFDGKAPAPDNPDAEPTREQFAVYMGQFLTDAVDGKTLYVLAGMTPGPTGVIDKVAKRRGVPAMEDSQQFDLIVAGRSYSLSMHAVMLYGSVDLGVWRGMAISASWLAKEDNGTLAVKIIKVKDSRQMAPPQEKTMVQTDDAGSFPVLPIVAILFLTLLGIQFMMRKRRKNV
jgi:hypothetical protein